jgi:hypothetical protein
MRIYRGLRWYATSEHILAVLGHGWTTGHQNRRPVPKKVACSKDSIVIPANEARVIAMQYLSW